MKRSIVSCFVVAVFLQFNCTQTKNESKTKAYFIPKDFQIRDSLVIDFNKDGISDIVLALQSSKEDLPNDFPGILIILKGINLNEYELSARNDTLIWCKTCGGIMGNPFDSFIFENDTLQINQAGGSASRWGFNYYCTYDNKTDNWFIVKKYSFNYNSNDPEESFDDSTNIYVPKIKL